MAAELVGPEAPAVDTEPTCSSTTGRLRVAADRDDRGARAAPRSARHRPAQHDRPLQANAVRDVQVQPWVQRGPRHLPELVRSRAACSRPRGDCAAAPGRARPARPASREPRPLSRASGESTSAVRAIFGEFGVRGRSLGEPPHARRGAAARHEPRQSGGRIGPHGGDGVRRSTYGVTARFDSDREGLESAQAGQRSASSQSGSARRQRPFDGRLVDEAQGQVRRA